MLRKSTLKCNICYKYVQIRKECKYCGNFHCHSCVIDSVIYECPIYHQEGNCKHNCKIVNNKNIFVCCVCGKFIHKNDKNHLLEMVKCENCLRLYCTKCVKNINVSTCCVNNLSVVNSNN